jgi:hypothetical protein
MRALNLLVRGIVLWWKRIEQRGPTLLFTARLRCACRMILWEVVLRCLAPSFSSAGRQDLSHLVSLQLATKEHGMAAPNHQLLLTSR